MKKLATLFNLILCFELILMPIDQSLFSIESAQANSCSQGQQWDSNLGRCLTDVETAKVLQATASCDPKDVECYKKNAQTAFDKEVAEDSSLKEKKANNKFMSTVGNAAGISMALYSAYALFKGNAASTCAKFSHGLMIAGGVSAFIGELYANQKHKKNLKEIESDWKKIVNTGHDGSDRDSKKVHATGAQSEAFEMLARVEDSNAENAKLKSTIHAISAAAFAGAAVAALLEFFPDGGVCPQATAAPAPAAVMNLKGELIGPTQTTPTLISQKQFNYQDNIYKSEMDQILREIRKVQYINAGVLKDDIASHLLVLSSSLNNISPDINTYQDFNKQSAVLENETGKDLISIIKLAASNLLLFPPAHAQAEVATGVAGKVGPALKSVGKFLGSAPGRATIGGVLSGWALIMFKHTKSQEKASKNRAAKLREMKAEFEGAAGTVNMCTPDDRSNTAKPECYCYTPEGQRNPNRGSSQICQKLWSGTLASAKDYKASTPGFSGCVNASNNYDSSCACKKSSKGCLSVSTKGVTGLGTGGLSLLNSGISPLNDMASGNFAKAEASQAGSINNAMRLLDAADKIASQPAYKDFNAKKDKAGLKLQNDLLKETARGSNLLANSGSSFNPGNIQEAVSMLEKQLDNDEIPKSVNPGNQQKVSVGSAAKKGADFDFNFASEEGAAGLGDQVSQVMKQDFDYAQNDINQSQTNLFELLSNRYQRSGMRRLFDDEGLTSPEAASTTDINN